MPEKRFLAQANSLVLLVTLGSVLIGLYARFKGLGLYSLSIDEYYLATSVNFILEKGLPAYDCGGYYVRGLLYQYLNAGILLATNLDPVLTMRTVNVLFNLLMLPAAFLLTLRLIQNWNAALLVLAILSLSLWEIEFARYFRMYAPFQAIFVWYLFCFYLAVVERNSTGYVFMLILSGISIFIYEGSIFLVALNFVPLFLVEKYRRPTPIIFVLLLFASAYLYLNFDFRHLGVTNPLPPDIALNTSSLTRSKISFPLVLFSTLAANPYWIIGSIPLFILSIFLVLNILKTDTISLPARMVLSGLAAASILNLFAVVLYGVTLLVTIRWIRINQLRDRAFIKFIYIFLIWFLFWFIYGTDTNEWRQWFNGEDINTLKKIFVLFFKYPDTFTKVIYPWFTTIPTTTTLLVFATLMGIFASIKNSARKSDSYLLFLFVLALSLLMMSTAIPPYYSTRYTFFLFPLVTILAVTGVALFWSRYIHKQTNNPTALFAYFFLYIFLSEDVNAYHIMNIDSQKVNFRQIYESESDNLSGHYWYRRDFKTPAETINAMMAHDDLVVSTLPAPDYYLKQLDYIFVEPQRLRGLSGCHGERELWTNSVLIYRESALFSLLQNADRPIWVIAYSNKYPFQNDVEKRLENNFQDALNYTSLDGRVNVYRLTPKTKLPQ